MPLQLKSPNRDACICTALATRKESAGLTESFEIRSQVAPSVEGMSCLGAERGVEQAAGNSSSGAQPSGVSQQGAQAIGLWAES